MTEKKKAVETAEPEIHPDTPLSTLLLDCTKDKYRLVSLATRWAQEVKVRDQSTLQPPELLDIALREILLKKVSLDTIEKLPPPPKVEKKDIEFTLPTLSLKDVPDEPADKAVEKE